MTRCPVLVLLALVTVTLLTVDVRFTARLLQDSNAPSVATLHSAPGLPTPVARRVDAGWGYDSTAGGDIRDAVSEPVADSTADNRLLFKDAAANLWHAATAVSTLVARHIRLQV